MSVEINPGAIAFIVIFLFPTSFARDFVNASTPALAAA